MSEDDNKQSIIDTPSQDESGFAVFPTIISEYISFGIGECPYGVRKIEAALHETSVTLGRVPFKLHTQTVVQ
jgi:hypothetical protein